MSSNIAFLGGGNMARAIAQGLQQQSHWQLWVADPNADAHDDWQRQFSAHTAAQPQADWLQADAVVLAVKPQQWQVAAAALLPYLNPKAVVISVMAGIPIAGIARALGEHSAIVRTMPNTPARVQQGITGLFAAAGVNEAQKSLAKQVLKSVGKTLWLDDEKLLDAVTAISGSGPAYVFYFIRALAEAGEKLGLSHAQATQLAMAAVGGATYLAEQSGESLLSLQQQVTSKGGTTAAALAVFDEQQFEQTVSEAAAAAHKRAGELAREFS